MKKLLVFATLLFLILLLAGAFIYFGPNIRVVNVVASPNAVEFGKPVTVFVDVKNLGKFSGSLNLILKINDNEEAVKNLTVDGGETKRFEFTVSKPPGIYVVKVDNFSDNFAVLKPAEFVFSDLQIYPSEVPPLNVVRISARVKNIGEVSGVYESRLLIDGITTETKVLQLKGGEEKYIEFTVTKELPKTYLVKLENLVGSFKVLKPAELVIENINFPDKVGVNETFYCSIKVRNVGEVFGAYSSALKIDGSEFDRGSIYIPPNQIAVLELKGKLSDLGQHVAELGGKTINFEVVEPIRFLISDITIVPSIGEVGEPVIIKAKVTNPGKYKTTHQIRGQFTHLEKIPAGMVGGEGISPIALYLIVLDQVFYKEVTLDVGETKEIILEEGGIPFYDQNFRATYKIAFNEARDYDFSIWDETWRQGKSDFLRYIYLPNQIPENEWLELIDIDKPILSYSVRETIPWENVAYIENENKSIELKTSGKWRIRYELVPKWLESEKRFTGEISINIASKKGIGFGFSGGYSGTMYFETNDELLIEVRVEAEKWAIWVERKIG